MQVLENMAQDAFQIVKALKSIHSKSLFMLLYHITQFISFSGISINDEAVNFAFAGDHVQFVFTGVDITNFGVGKTPKPILPILLTPDCKPGII